MPTCRTDGCCRSRRGRDLLCGTCWRLVPEPIRAEILRHHKPGSIRQSDEYFAAVRDAIDTAQAARRPAGRRDTTTTDTSSNGGTT